MNGRNRTRDSFTLAALMVAVLLLFGASGVHAWDLSEPTIESSEGRYIIEHRFESSLDPDSLLALLYNPENFAELNRDRPVDMEILPPQGGNYDVVARYKFLWFYKNRMVLRRHLSREERRVTSELVGFWQTLGVAPEPRSSLAVYEISSRPGGGSHVEFLQVTEFEGDLSPLANRTFSNATIDYLLTTERYIHFHETPGDQLVMSQP